MRNFGTHTASGEAAPRQTWRQIREQMEAQYARSYNPAELRSMELKWRRIFAECGWSVKGI